MTPDPRLSTRSSRMLGPFVILLAALIVLALALGLTALIAGIAHSQEQPWTSSSTTQPTTQHQSDAGTSNVDLLSSRWVSAATWTHSQSPAGKQSNGTGTSFCAVQSSSPTELVDESRAAA